jgi:hypothetical protein
VLTTQPRKTICRQIDLFVSSLAYRPLDMKVGYQLKEASAFRRAHAENVDLNFLVPWCLVRLNALGTSATIWPIVPTPGDS